MPVIVKWYGDDQTIIESTMTDPWSYADLLTAMDQAQALIENVSHPIYVISDLSATRQPPRIDVNGLRKINNHPMNAGKRISMTYMLRSPIMVKVTLNVATRLFPRLLKNVKAVSSVEEVLQDIQRRRPAQT